MPNETTQDTRYNLVIDNVALVTHGRPVERSMAVGVRNGTIACIASAADMRDQPADRRAPIGNACTDRRRTRHMGG